MSNTVKPRTASIVSQYPIQQGSSNNGQTPQQILYLNISIKMSKKNLEFFINPAGPHPSGPYSGDIGDFIDGLFESTHRQPLSTFPGGPLDFQITMPSYVVIELDRAFNWSFREDTDAVTLDDAYLGEYYNLNHVISPTNIVPGPGLPVGAPYPAPHPGCNIAYFSAISPSFRQLDSMNLYATLVQVFQSSPGNAVTGSLDIILDPDIQNTGGGSLMGGGGGRIRNRKQPRRKGKDRRRA